MGREIRRVPLDFDWPHDKTWHGFLMPDSLRETVCAACDGNGWSTHASALQDLWYGNLPFHPVFTGSTPFTIDTPEVRAFAERNVQRSPGYYGTGETAIQREARRLLEHWNSQWGHHLSQEDVDALVAADRLRDFTHTHVPGEGWKPIDPPPQVTADQVNLWSLSGFGHGSSNCWIVVRARCEKDGKPYKCGECDGHGSNEAYPGQRAEAEAWEPVEPPTGDGWQLWQTVSEGSPISPVFATREEFADWLCSDAYRWGASQPMSSREAALRFIDSGWAPSMVVTNNVLVSGEEFMGQEADQ